ncbi:hypothetical protein HPB48_026054 [Haemaphysalis longicornis]|uniref:Uncharacterized protein n=1 Tax=Haemaphysalis longicornis TaxID=44386 RepID=A0A9J6H059_HAELO|nr:hypothetical protein HPB48_026054 [Haemaphysalis longicornis]
MKAISAKQDSRHAEVMGVLFDVRKNQVELTQKVSHLATRLTTVKAAIESFEGKPPTTYISNIVSEVVQNESEATHLRLNDLEDRCRRDNLLFYGISDNYLEKWEDSEKCVHGLLSRYFNMHLTEDMIVRAHRLGKVVENKTPPIIVKFLSFKQRIVFCRKRKN